VNFNLVVEEANAFEHRVLARAVDAQDMEARAAVGLVDEIAQDVHVVVDDSELRIVGVVVDRVAEGADVPDQGASVRDGAVGLVELVVEEEVALVLGEPALVGVVDVVVGLTREHLRLERVLEVPDGQGVLVAGEAE
jgi:hypothetical protein